MADRSKIEWTDATVNFWWGCTKVGPPCDHCYAETFDKRVGGSHWGPGAPRRKIESAADALRKLNRGHAKFHQEHGRRRRIFMHSMSDLFDNEVPDDWRAEAYHEAQQAKNLDIQFLTKRVGNVEKMAFRVWEIGGWPPHIGLMITVGNQEEADRDVPKLLALKAKYRIPWVGISAEPLLGPIDFTKISQTVCLAHAGACCGDRPWMDALRGIQGCSRAGAYSFPTRNQMPRGLDWVIIGGESGPRYRGMDLAAAYSIQEHCKAAGVAVFFKQDSGPRSGMRGRASDALWAAKEFPK